MRGQIFGDVLMVLVLPLVIMVVGGFLAILLAHNGNLGVFLPAAGY
ncbi:hypothetical protein [Saccharopolyspora sp. NPDC002686]